MPYDVGTGRKHDLQDRFQGRQTRLRGCKKVQTMSTVGKHAAHGQTVAKSTDTRSAHSRERLISSFRLEVDESCTLLC
jgi:hypothetical protein